MVFEEAYLKDLVERFAASGIYPYSTGNNRKIEEFLSYLVGRLSDIKTTNVRAGFDHYGSGYASYVYLYISKKDKSDLTEEKETNGVTLTTNGLMLYLSRVAPVAVYGRGTWTKTYINDKEAGSSSHFLEPEMLGNIPSEDWASELSQIWKLLMEFGFSMPDKEELARELPFSLDIPTVLSDPPFRVFDCL